MSRPFLSVIIPAHNESKRLPLTLNRALEFLESQTYSSELIVVENGSQDDTLAVALQFEDKSPLVRVLHETMAGKGLAVRTGMLVARGEYKFMADADLSMPIAEINRFLPQELGEYDVAIGSREAKGAVRYDEPAYRHLGGRLINGLIRLLALPGLHDTQCGFKCFRSAVAEDLFRSQTVSGWSFDIELLYIARLRGYRIVEVPIPWYFNPESKLNVVRDSLHMVTDIIQIRQNARRGMYDYLAKQPVTQTKPEN